MRQITYLLIALASTMLIYSCKYNGPQLMPNVSGKPGEVVVVMDKQEWQGDAGTVLRNILGAYQPYLPQENEPMFDLVNITRNNFNWVTQIHRNIVVTQVVPDIAEPKVVFQENVWAAPQLVATISVQNPEQLQEVIQANSDRLTGAFLQAERNRHIQNAKKYENVSLRTTVTELFNGSPYFPTGYSLKRRTNDFIWISYETTYTNQGVFVYRFPYTGEETFYLENLLDQRDDFLMRNVPAQLPNTYMTTNRAVEPGIRHISFNRKNYVEVRGLWEVHNDFMGGPFVSLFLLDPTEENVIALEAFVYAPRFDKRNYLRQVESIIYSFEFF